MFRRKLCQPSLIKTFNLNRSGTVTTAVQNHNGAIIILHHLIDIVMTLTQVPPIAKTNLCFHDDTAMTLHLLHSHTDSPGTKDNRTIVRRINTAGGTLVQSICRERRIVMPSEQAHWMNWRSSLLLIGNEEAEERRGEKKKGETMKWSFGSSVDTPPTVMVLHNIITTVKMSSVTAATMKIVPHRTGKIEITSVHCLLPKSIGAHGKGRS